MRWLLALVAGCGFSASLTGDNAGGELPMTDAAIDAPPDAFDPKCFGGGTFYVCLPNEPTASVSVTAGIDTSTCGGTNQSVITIGGVSVCAITGNTIGVSTSIGVVGNRPLALIGVTSVAISGLIDASSRLSSFGPGANYEGCPTNIDGASNTNGGGGGAGGSFGTGGAPGGNGGGGTGGTPANPPPKPTILRGGCRGGRGQPGVGAVPTDGGPGGGVVLLVSRGTLTISGIVDASGGGGTAGSIGKTGGGGGGSGGMVVIHAGTLNITGTARINANGGGGGGGGGNASPGDPGANPDETMIETPALGGQTTTAGAAKGGNGAAGPTNATPGSTNSNGGGAGGGGHGVIRIIKGGLTVPTGTCSPAPTN